MRNEGEPLVKGWGRRRLAFALLIMLAFVLISATCTSVPSAKAGTELSVQPVSEPATPVAPSVVSTDDDSSVDYPTAVKTLVAPSDLPLISLLEEPLSPFPENTPILSPPEAGTVIMLSEPSRPVLPRAPVVETAPVIVAVETLKPALPSQSVPAPESNLKPAAAKVPATIPPVTSVPKTEPKPEAKTETKTETKTEPKPVPKPPQAAPAEPIPPPVEKKPVPLPPSGLPELPARTAPIVVEDPVVYSRSIRLSVGQLLEVPFRSAGWVFLGEQGARKGLPYDSRRLDKEGQSFIFRAELEGNYSLKFYRQDFINDYIVNDYVQVVVEAPSSGAVVGGFSLPVDRGRVVAEPRWPPISAATASGGTTEGLVSANTGKASGTTGVSSSPVPSLNNAIVQGQASMPAPTPSTIMPSAISSSPSATSSIATIPVAPAVTPTATTPATAAVSPQSAVVSAPRNVRAAADAIKVDAAPEIYFAAAKTEGDAGRTDSALAILDVFIERYPSGSDEALWLYGRFLEANGPNKDIKSALAFYRRLVQEYPQSQRYDEARKRVAYLERYYFDIR